MTKVDQTMSPVLSVQDLSVGFQIKKKLYLACEDINFNLYKNKTLCLVGESGSGKSVTAQSLFVQSKLSNFHYKSGEILLHGKNVMQASKKEKNDLRGKTIAYIPQSPFKALNPVQQVGAQVAEAYDLHYKSSRQDTKARVIAYFKKVGISAPEQRFHAYPHELSGGMMQRVMIAHALICEPDILIADEPTTALDVTIQSQILNLIKDMQKETGMAVLFITHNFGVVAQIADDVAVMYAGHIVEQGSLNQVMMDAKHPYTKALLKSVIRLDEQEVKDLYSIDGTVPALKNYPQHCRFMDRCEAKQKQCENYDMRPIAIGQTRQLRCHLAKNL